MVSLSQLLSPKERVFFDLFEEAGSNLVNASELLERMLNEWPEHGELGAEVLRLEQNGDRITHEIIQRLNQTFVTPFDSEDIYSLASGLDDVLDFIEEVADFLALYRIEKPSPYSQRFARTLTLACHAIADAIPRLRTLSDISHFTIEVNRLENEGDRLIREALARLFEEVSDPLMVIKWKDIFERLEDAIDATETVANILEGIVIKNT